MTTINLLQSEAPKESVSKGRLMRMGYVFPVLVLIFVALAYAGLKVYNLSLTSQDQSIQTQTKQELDSISQPDINKIVDFQGRMNEIKTNISSDDFYGSFFNQLQATTTEGTSVQKLNNDKDGLKVTYVSSNFFQAAKQILSCKKSDYFSSASVSEISRNTTDGTISLTLSLEVAKKK